MDYNTKDLNSNTWQIEWVDAYNHMNALIERTDNVELKKQYEDEYYKQYFFYMNLAQEGCKAREDGYKQVSEHINLFGIKEAQAYFHAEQRNAHKRYIGTGDCLWVAQQWADGGLSALLDFNNTTQEDNTMNNQAYYTATRKIKFVTIHKGGRVNDRIGTRFEVANMKEAKQVAQQHNASPWNF